MEYLPLTERTLDTQYKDRLRFILKNGVRANKTPQGFAALTCFGTVPPMIYDLRNGFPVITERKMGFWRKPIAEIIAFMNGARTVDEIAEYGCDFWEEYRGRGVELGLEPNDLGPGSYGPAFHDFEVPEGGTLNQFEQVVDQIRNYPEMRTHLVTPWKPYYTARGERRKVQVAPCHGWLHFRFVDGKLHMKMNQRSGDFPIGVPSNTVQYAALLLMVCQVTNLEPGLFIHNVDDAHIYENQIPAVRKLLRRKSRPYPSLAMNRGVNNLFKFKVEDFHLREYTSGAGLKIPFAA